MHRVCARGAAMFRPQEQTQTRARTHTRAHTHEWGDKQLQHAKHSKRLFLDMTHIRLFACLGLDSLMTSQDITYDMRGQPVRMDMRRRDVRLDARQACIPLSIHTHKSAGIRKADC